MKKTSLAISLCFVLTAFIILVSCSKKSNSTTPPPVTSGNKVTIANFTFNSNDLHVAAGTTVTWTNNDNAPHTVSADDGSFTSATLNNGDTYSKTFSTVGTYHYHCNIHSMMKAEVVVE